VDSGGLLLQLVTALGAALVGAAVALRLRQPLLLGYLLAGVAIGPFIPGVLGSGAAIGELAELGVIFLMFVIGVQLSWRDLLRASRIALWGGLLQVVVMIGLGYLAGRAWGWGHLEAYAFGAVISNSSSTVLSKILGDKGETDSRHAQLALAWSSVQDISTVALVAVLAVASPRGQSLAPLLGKAALFFFALVPLAFFVLPWLLRQASSLRSREFFVVAVVTLALAMAGGASLLGVSLALGAFLAGVVVGESDVVHRVLGDAIPLRDVFSGIFFVSIGMLLDPAFVVSHWPVVLGAVALMVGVKGAVSAALARFLGCSPRLAVLVGAALAQSGEFSFLLARIGQDSGALSEPVFHLLLSAAVVSIVLAPGVHALAPHALRRLARPAQGRPVAGEPPRPTAMTGHAVVCGYGRVGSTVCSLLERQRAAYVVVEEDLRRLTALRARGIPAVFGDAAQPHVLDRAHLAKARLLILCIPEKMAARRAVEHAHAINPQLGILARTHSWADLRYLSGHGVAEPVLGEVELALELGRRALERFEAPGEEIEQAIAAERRALADEHRALG
jgi:monovalent cation:H+ antiporter-2, CPA2 family